MSLGGSLSYFAPSPPLPLADSMIDPRGDTSFTMNGAAEIKCPLVGCPGDATEGEKTGGGKRKTLSDGRRKVSECEGVGSARPPLNRDGERD